MVGKCIHAALSGTTLLINISVRNHQEQLEIIFTVTLLINSSITERRYQHEAVETYYLYLIVNSKHFRFGW
jgi:hypothetical protein